MVDWQKVKAAKRKKKQKKVVRDSQSMHRNTKTSAMITDPTSNPSEDIVYRHPESKYIKTKYIKNINHDLDENVEKKLKRFMIQDEISKINHTKS